MLRWLAPNMALIWLGIVLLICFVAWLSAFRRDRARYPQVFYGIGATVKDALLSRHMFWVFILSAGVTAFLALSGYDWTFQRYMQEAKPLGYPTARFFLVWGNFWHVGGALFLLAYARLRGNRRLFSATCAATQAMIIQLVVITGLKFLTGRTGPLNPDRVSSAAFVKTTDPADFAFDFWNYTFVDGRFFWPSGHTATAFSFAAAFTFALWWPKTSIPMRIFIVFLWALAALSGFAMVDGDFHWVSDVLAGGAIGILLGIKTGRSFRRRYPGSNG
jgi:membrane-associated phospholipid phosphatase